MGGVKFSGKKHYDGVRFNRALVRPHLEICLRRMGPPHTLQRCAARYVCNCWHNTSSVTGMLSQLEWVPLATCRANTRVDDVQSCSYTSRGPLDSLADIRAAHHSGVPCVEIYSIINITRRLQILFLTMHNNSLEPTAFHYHSCSKS